MFKLRRATLAVSMGALVLAVAYAGELALNVRTGLWQNTVAMQTSGQIPISDSDLAKMSPERRAQFEAAMKAAMASAAQPHVITSCVTAEQLRKGFSFKDENNPACKRQVVSISASAWEMHEECTGTSARTATIRFRASTPEEIDGKMEMTMTRGDRTMTSNGTIHGKWLAADCGSVKPGGAVEKSAGQ
jgi:hypothetical protein